MIAAAPPPLAADLVESLRRLRLGTMRQQAPEVLQTAITQRWSPEEVLRSLLQAEIASRDAANRRIRLKQGGFPVLKTLETSNWRIHPSRARPLSTSRRSNGCVPKRTCS